MVDKPSLTLQGGISRAGGVSVPREISIPNLRQATSVDVSGIRRGAAAAGAQARIANRNAALFKANADSMLEEEKERQRKEAERIYVDSALLFEQEYNTLKQNADPRAGNFTQQSLDAYDAFVNKQTAREGLSNFQREVLSDRFALQRVNVGTNSISYQNEMEHNAATVDFESYFETQHNRLRANPDLVEQIEFEVEEYVANSPVLRNDPKTQRFVSENLSSGYVMGLIEGGYFDKAQEALDSDEFNKLLDPDMKAALESDLETAVNKVQSDLEAKQSEWQSQNNQALRTQILLNPDSVTTASILNAGKTGQILPQQMNDRLSQLITAQKKEKTDRDFVILGQHVYNNGPAFMGTTEDERKGLEAYDKAAEASLSAMPSEQRVPHEVNQMMTANYVTKFKKDKYKEMGMSQDPSKVLEVAEILDMLDVNQSMLSNEIVSAEVEDRVRDITRRINDGQHQQDAVKAYDERIRLNRSTSGQGTLDRIRTERDEIDFQEEIFEELDGSFFAEASGFIARTSLRLGTLLGDAISATRGTTGSNVAQLTSKEMPMALRPIELTEQLQLELDGATRRAQRSYTDMRIKGIDPETAKKRAIREETRKLGVETITGRKEVMRYPPSNYYAPNGTKDSLNALQTLFDADVKERLIGTLNSGEEPTVYLEYAPGITNRTAKINAPVYRMIITTPSNPLPRPLFDPETGSEFWPYDPSKSSPQELTDRADKVLKELKEIREND